MDNNNFLKSLSKDLIAEAQNIMNAKIEIKKQTPAEIDEALKGKQHKIDKNKNGKIDAHDFALLRKEDRVIIHSPYAPDIHGGLAEVTHRDRRDGSITVMFESMQYKLKKGQFKELPESVEELDELSRKTLSSYVKKAVPSMRGLEDASDRAHQKGHEAYKAGATKTSDKFLNLSDRHLKKSAKRGEGINTALNKLAKEEVEESVKNPYAIGMAAAMKSTGDTPPLKKSTIVKAHEIAKKIKEETEEVTEDAEQISEISTKTVDSYREKAYAQQPAGDDGSKLYKKRKAGRDMAFKKVTHGAKVPATNEEFEQIDELSKDTVSKYANKAFDQSNSILKSRNMDLPKSVKKSAEDAKERRRKGIVSAGKRLGDDEMKKIAQSSANRIVYNREDVELTQEEIDRLDAILADLDEARGRPPKEGSEAWKRRQAEGEASADEPRQHPIQQLERIKRDMRGGGEFLHKDGTKHHVTGAQAAKLLDKYHGLKPAQKQEMQGEIHASHAGLKKHL